MEQVLPQIKKRLKNRNWYLDEIFYLFFHQGNTKQRDRDC